MHEYIAVQESNDSQKLVMIQIQLATIQTDIKNILEKLNKMTNDQTIDHENVIKIMANREFFWGVFIKIIVPTMFALFGLGWAIGKFAQHISVALGW